jgi:N-acetylneuraminic acid mutarotase
LFLEAAIAAGFACDDPRMSRTGTGTGRTIRLLISFVVAALVVALASSTASAGTTPSGKQPNAAAASTAKKAASPISGGAHPTKRVCADVTKAGLATCMAELRTDIKGAAGVHPAVTPDGYGPSDLDSAYNLPSSTAGSGVTVGIVDAFDYPQAEAELAIYRAQYGLPACTTANGCFTRVDQRGGTAFPVQDSSWQQEEALDLDMVSAICPNCHIVLVEADDNSLDNLGASVNQAVAQGAGFVSNSYGGPEDPSELQGDTAFFHHPGVAITASTGDRGFGVQYPAASPDVTGVGGTTLVTDSSARGWSESAWSGAGSGCSAVEPKPAFQQDTGCANRSVADVSAVADPNTGVAVYVQGAWRVFGGTSVASPVIASTYALAGTPAAGSDPVAFPYADTAALNDVTSGANGTCATAYLCTAGPGYDGPTGLGTPNGLAAFAGGPAGVVAGTVTDGTAGLAGVQVLAGTRSTITDAQGHYSLTVPAGTYTVTASKFGFASGTTAGVVIGDGQTVTEDFALTAVPNTTVSGLVRDGSGHGWPVYAQVQVAGEPTTAVYTDSATGHYSLTVPQGATYAVQVDPVYTGYVADTAQVPVGTDDVLHDVSVKVDATTCSAAGYHFQQTGTTQTFDGAALPAGWTVTDDAGTAQTWGVTDPGSRGNLTGGSGGFAMVDSDNFGQGNVQDTSLITPVTDFSTVANPTLQFANDYDGFSNQTGDVDYTTDGGATWQHVWQHATDSVRGPGTQAVTLPGAAGKSAVQVRFRFTGHWGFWWELDNVFLGNRSCVPTSGGLVVGHVTDRNTGNGVNGATVTSTDHPADGAVTAATADPGQGNGFFWMFSSLTGSHPFAAAASTYTTVSQQVKVAANFATVATFSLPAGQLSVNTTSISKTVAWQGTASQAVKVTNTGTASVDVKLSPEPGTFTLAGQGAPLVRIKGDYAPGPLVGPRAARRLATPATAQTPSAAPWQALADYPTSIMDNGVTTVNGKVYSFTGFDGSGLATKNFVYDPGTQAWTALADIPTPRENPEVASIGGKVYVIGGWGNSGDPVPTTAIYDPASDTWSTGAANPKPYAASGVAVLGGKIYLVGGCSTNACGVTDVEVYDPASDTWSAGPSTPAAVAWESCGAISGALYCAGGNTDAAPLSTGYSFTTASGTWSPIAALPETLWASGATVAGGKLLMSGGVGNAALTNAGFAYDPGTNTWAALPNSNNTLYRGGSACGLYKIGGSSGNFSATNKDELLPGQDVCAETVSIPWLSVSPAVVTLAPGKSATFTVGLNANIPSITQPGTFTATLAVSAAVPQPVAAIPVSLTVNPPATWGKITGTITGLGCTSGSAPIPGATVQIDSWAASYTLKTDASGRYALWLDVRNNPLTVIVAKDGWQPQTAQVKIAKKKTVTSDYSLKSATC